MLRRILSQLVIVALVVGALGTAAAASPAVARAETGVLFSFAQISDSQPRDALEQARFEQVLDTIVASGDPGALIPQPVRFVVFAGDLVDKAGNQSEWTTWLATMNSRLTANGIPYRTVPGNHDRNSSIGFANYEQNIGSTAVWDTGVDVVAGQNGITVNTGWRGLRIVGVNNSNLSNNQISAADVADVDLRVATASAAGENVMVMAHHPHGEGGSIPLATSLSNPDVVGYMRGHTGSPRATKGLSGVSNPNIWDLNSNGIINRAGILYYEVYQSQLVVYPIQLTLNSTTLPAAKTIALPHALSPAGPPGSPTAGFSGAPLSGSAPLAVGFTDQSSGTPTSWSWDFGDSGTSTLQNPTHTYASPGTYTVSLSVTNAQGGDTETKTGYVTVTDPGGGGGQVAFAAVVSGVSGSATSVTSDPVSVTAGHLYVATVSTKGHQAVSGVAGLGGTWSLEATRCSGRNQTGVSVYVSANATSSGAVTATLAGSVTSAVITVAAYSGVDLADPVGAASSANTNGIGGSCSGGSDTTSYSMPLTTTASFSLVVGAVALRNRTHEPGIGWTERIEVQSGSGGTMAGVAVFDRVVAAPGTVTVAGTMSGSVDWALAAIELRAGSSGPPTPAPDVSVSPSTLAFGSVLLTDPAAELTITVSNAASATADLDISSLVLTAGGPEFAITGGEVSGSPLSVAPGSSHTATIAFDPGTVGPFSGNVRISTNDPDSPVIDVALSGQGAAEPTPTPDVSVSPSSLAFGSVLLTDPAAELTITVSNAASATADLDISSLVLTAGGPEFAITGGEVSGPALSVAPGSSHTATIAFDPGTVGPFSGNVRISTNDPDSPVIDVALSGQGAEPGGGGQVAFEGIVTGGSLLSPNVTSGSVAVTAGRFYVASVSTKSHQAVTSVSGLGGTWTLVATQCAGRLQTGVSVFASANATTSGTVTATLAGAPSAAVIAVAEYSGVNLADPVGAVSSANSNGTGAAAACSGGVDTTTYAMPLTTTASSSLVVGAVAIRNRTHTPDAGWTEEVEAGSSSGGTMAGVAVIDRQVGAAGPITVSGSFSGLLDWALVAIEIKAA